MPQKAQLFAGTIRSNLLWGNPDADDDALWEALTDISFDAKRGETIGVIGPTGCGKSTLVQLIPRFYDATKRSGRRRFCTPIASLCLRMDRR